MSMYTKSRRSVFAGAVIIPLLAALSQPAALRAEATRSEIEGKPGGVAVETSPPSGATVYAVEEVLPPSAFPRRISHDGVFDPHTNKVKWGPFYDDLPRELTFEVSLAEGDLVLSGAVSYDSGGALPTSGIGDMDLPNFETYFAGWQNRYLAGEQPLLPADYVVPGSSAPLLVQYAMGQAPGEPGSPFRIVRLENGQRELRYERDLRRDDVAVQLQVSEDLAEWIPWHPSSAIVEALDEHTEAIRVPANESDLYYRVRIRVP